jgi:hypothetical protein
MENMMRFWKLFVLLICLGIASSATAQTSDPEVLAQSSQQVKQGADNDVELREAIHRLAVESPDVGREYEHLASEPLESRRHLFAAFPSSMKSAVWVHHLLRAVTTHPEFTAEQRSIIYDGIRLLSPEQYDTQSAATSEAVHDLTVRAQRLFSRDVALAVFAEIGSAIPFAAAPEAGVELNRESANRTEGDQRALPKRDPKSQPPVRALNWNCDCNVFSDWCAIRNGGDSNWTCHAAECNLSDFGCGTLGMRPCDGLCVYTNPDT